ncbi:MAG: hypothetical protein V2J07_10295 [Anaerolineae bacterium]|jgi:hypothetical protein|nr:hypothetical protein [Anaerolineae bacterium]
MTNFWLFVGFFLSLMVLSYLVGDNPMFRLAIYLFIGVTAGYLAVMIVYQIILPKLVLPMKWGGEYFLWSLVPWALSILLVTRLFPKVSRLGNIPLAYVVGVSSAVIISGALMGTLATQVFSVINLFELDGQTQGAFWSLVEGVYVLFGTVSTLLYFQFFAPKENPGKPNRLGKWIKVLRFIGQIFLSMTLGALFAGAYLTALMAMITRINELGYVFWMIFSR